MCRLAMNVRLIRSLLHPILVRRTYGVIRRSFGSERSVAYYVTLALGDCGEIF